MCSLLKLPGGHVLEDGLAAAGNLLHVGLE